MANLTAKDVLEQVDSFGIGPAARPVVKDALTLLASWPKELTRERLEGVSDSCDSSGLHNSAADIQRLAAIAPVRKKRVVNLWKHPNPAYEILAKSAEWTPFPDEQWRKVAGPIELEE